MCDVRKQNESKRTYEEKTKRSDIIKEKRTAEPFEWKINSSQTRSFRNMNTQFYSLRDETPQQYLAAKAQESDLNLGSLDFAAWMDYHDPLGHIRQEFSCPKLATLPKSTYSTDDSHINRCCLWLILFPADPTRANSDEDCVYLCGQSLGLMPKRCTETITAFLNDWANLYATEACALQKKEYIRVLFTFQRCLRSFRWFQSLGKMWSALYSNHE